METNFKFGEVDALASQVKANKDHAVVKNIFSAKHGEVALLAFEEGQQLETHVSPFAVMVTVLEGEIEFTMNGKPNNIKAGEFLLMGEEVPHSVKALKESKVMLVKMKI